VDLYNRTKGTLLADRVIMADNFFARLKGLLGKPGLNPGNCLVIKPCRCVHTMFMRFAIDVIFLGSDGQVLALIENLRPFRFSPYVRGAWLAVELPAGTLSRAVTAVGDLIIFREE